MVWEPQKWYQSYKLQEATKKYQDVHFGCLIDQILFVYVYKGFSHHLDSCPATPALYILLIINIYLKYLPRKKEKPKISFSYKKKRKERKCLIKWLKCGINQLERTEHSLEKFHPDSRYIKWNQKKKKKGKKCAKQHLSSYRKGIPESKPNTWSFNLKKKNLKSK